MEIKPWFTVAYTSLEAKGALGQRLHRRTPCKTSIFLKTPLRLPQNILERPLKLPNIPYKHILNWFKHP